MHTVKEKRLTLLKALQNLECEGSNYKYNLSD